MLQEKFSLAVELNGCDGWTTRCRLKKRWLAISDCEGPIIDVAEGGEHECDIDDDYWSRVSHASLWHLISLINGVYACVL